MKEKAQWKANVLETGGLLPRTSVRRAETPQDIFYRRARHGRITRVYETRSELPFGEAGGGDKASPRWHTVRGVPSRLPSQGLIFQ